MGKIQCVAYPKHGFTRDYIERSLKNADTPLEKKIHDEYFTLKNKWKETGIDFYREKLDNLVRWYKTIHGDDMLDRRSSTGLNYVPSSTKTVPINQCYTDYNNDFNKSINQNSNRSNEIEINFKRVQTLTPLNQNLNINNPQSISSIEQERENISFTSLSQSASNNELNVKAEYLYENKLRQVCDKNKSWFHEKVLKGPPESLRWLCWVICADIPRERSKQLFLELYNAKSDDQADSQIKKDLNRTLAEITLNENNNILKSSEIHQNNLSESSNKSLSFSEDPVQNYLYRLLRAFSNADKEVSYCQGMNFIAGFLLLVSDFNETEALYLFMALFSNTFNNLYGIRGFFSENFPLLNAYTYAFNHFFQRKMPTLKNHFLNLEIPDEVWILKWIQTLYTISLPLDASMRLYDCLFSQGLHFIISFSIAFVKSFENDLIKLGDSFDVIDYFKSVFQGKNGKGKNWHRQLYIEEIISYAMKLDITSHCVNNLIHEYEHKFNVDLEKLNKKYDLTLKNNFMIKNHYSSASAKACSSNEVEICGNASTAITGNIQMMNNDYFLQKNLMDSLNTLKVNSESLIAPLNEEDEDQCNLSDEKESVNLNEELGLNSQISKKLGNYHMITRFIDKNNKIDEPDKK
jgi:hypothetical protein